jgi:hypothetical protein
VFGVGFGAVLVAVIEGLPGCLGGASWNGSLGMKYGPERRHPVADHHGQTYNQDSMVGTLGRFSIQGLFFDAVAKGVHPVVSLSRTAQVGR